MADLAGKDYFTVPEAAEYAGISVSHWRARIQREFPPGKFYGKLLYRRADVQRYLGIHQDQYRAADRQWRRGAGYYASRKHRTPAWADLGLIAALHDIARRVSECTGIAFHVDHVIPLHGKEVSGLHAQNNLRIIFARRNLIKGSKFHG